MTTAAPDWLRFNPPVVAHRGASGRVPENTLAAFNAAADDGAQWLETDVKLSRNGVALLFHDDTLERTTNGTGAVAQTDETTLAQLDAGGWFGPAFRGERIPRLAELLALLQTRNLHLNLELKPCPGRVKETTEAVLREIAQIWPDRLPPILFSSFELEALLIAKDLQPDWPRGLLLDGWPADWAAQAAACNPATLHPDAAALTASRMRELCATGRPVIPWTVNDPTQAQQLLDWGASAVFTDHPARLIAHLTPVRSPRHRIAADPVTGIDH